jgi:hypothetical protein
MLGLAGFCLLLVWLWSERKLRGSAFGIGCCPSWLDLTIKCVGELKSKRLIEVVTKIVVKLKAALQNRLIRLIDEVDVPMAKKLGDIAWGWEQPIRWRVGARQGFR